MIAVLGGGISGLSIAHELKKQGHHFILLEQDPLVGGKIRSQKTEDYTLEYGPNTVLINNGEIKQLLNELGLEQELIVADSKAVKNRQVLFNGKIEPLPKGPISLIKSKLFGMRSVIKLFQEPFLGQRIEFEGEEESLAEFIRRRLGIEIYENFVYPFVTGVYAGDPEKMSTDYTLKVLKEAEKKHGSILKGMRVIFKAKKKQAKADGLPKEKIFTFKEGLQRLPNRLHEVMKNEIQTDVRINRVIRIKNGYMLVYWHEGALRKKIVKQIISTLPAPKLAALIKWDNNFTEAMNSIHYVPAYVSHFAYSKKDLELSKKSFGLLSRRKENAPFLGLLFNNHFFEHTAPKDQELITVISGGHKQSNYKSKSDNAIQKTIKTYLAELFDIKNKPIFESLYRWQEAIPQYELGHYQWNEAMVEFERKNPGFYIQGNFIDGISVSDCISRGTLFARNHFN